MCVCSVTDFVELRSYYVDIVRNMPDDYLKTVQLLENHLCDLHISAVFECTSALDANQKIMACLLENVNYKAHVLDFCEVLASLKVSQLVNVVENLRRGMYLLTYTYVLTYIINICTTINFVHIGV